MKGAATGIQIGGRLLMTGDEANEVLSRVESNLFADLYKSRWSAGYASFIVPDLIKCLEVDDKSILLRALSALDRIGPEAKAAGPIVCPLLEHRDTHVRINAIHALTSVYYRNGRRALAPLVRATKDPDLLKDAMFGLISLGHAAKSTKEVFITAYSHKDGRIRRLGLRGLSEIGAEGPDVIEVVTRAAHDKNSQVKAAALKLSRALGIAITPGTK